MRESEGSREGKPGMSVKMIKKIHRVCTCNYQRIDKKNFVVVEPKCLSCKQLSRAGKGPVCPR